jgi:hypothetical protein
MEMENRLRRVAIWLCGLMLVAYGADALYPTWDYSCSGRDVRGFFVGPNHIPELEADPTARVLRPTVPAGCKVHAHNSARNVFDWLTSL